MTTRTSVAADLVWAGDLKFGATSGTHAVVVDGKSEAGPSPMQLLAMSLAGCMSMDVVDILRKGRHPLAGLRTALEGERASEPPRRLVKATLRFHVHGDVPAAAVERAIALSHDKYCSVWHTLRHDLEFVTTYDITPEP